MQTKKQLDNLLSLAAPKEFEKSCSYCRKPISIIDSNYHRSIDKTSCPNCLDMAIGEVRAEYCKPPMLKTVPPQAMPGTNRHGRRVQAKIVRSPKFREYMTWDQIGSYTDPVVVKKGWFGRLWAWFKGVIRK